MIIKSALLLTSLLICLVQGNDTGIPVTIKDLKDIRIEDYHGSMDAKTLEVFENAESLTLASCNFSNFNENFVQHLKNLQTLIVANSHFNKVNSDISTCCKKLKNIEVINTDFGILTDSELKKISEMPQMERLYLFKINAPTLFAKAFVGSNLKKLEIEQSKLENVPNGSFDGMDKLELLNLKNNKLKAVPSLGSLKNLKELDLSGNLLEKVKTSDFPNLPLLETMNLGHNPIKEMDMKGLKEKMPNLKEVDVSGVDIDLSNTEGINFVKKAIL